MCGTRERRQRERRLPAGARRALSLLLGCAWDGRAISASDGRHTRSRNSLSEASDDTDTASRLGGAVLAADASKVVLHCPQTLLVHLAHAARLQRHNCLLLHTYMMKPPTACKNRAAQNKIAA